MATIYVAPKQTILETEKSTLAVWRNGTGKPLQAQISWKPKNLQESMIGNHNIVVSAKTWIFSDLRGMKAYSDLDYTTARKYNLSVDDMLMMEWASVQDLGNTCQYAEDKKAADAEYAARVKEQRINWLKRHGLYERWEYNQREAGQRVMNDIAKERARIRKTRVRAAVKKQCPDHYLCDYSDSTYIFRSKADDGRDLTGKYSKVYTLAELEKMLGLPGEKMFAEAK